MDQNLRGARALTAENLQRVASLHVNQAPYRSRFLGSDGSMDVPASRQASNTLGHNRGRSDAVVLDAPRRPQTAMARESLTMSSEALERGLADSAAWTANTLRGTRSQELPRNPSRALQSPDPILETLMEDDSAALTPERLNRRVSSSASPPVTNELQQQMQQLNKRISTLREKARKDSLRRQSQQAYREPNPFTDAERLRNANGASPNHTDSEGSPDLRVPQPTLVSRWSADSSVKRNSVLPAHLQVPMLPSPQEEDATSSTSHTGSFQSVSPEIDWRPVGHIRQVSRADSAPVHDVDVEVSSSKGLIVESPGLGSNDSSSVLDEFENNTHKDPADLAHEDRADAFDYRSFYLHSGGGGVDSSDSASDASDDTARGPKIDPESFPMLGTPRTPEMLRKIERAIHQRQMSNTSISTDNSFTTATEGGLRSGRQSPTKKANGSDGADSGVAVPNMPYHKRQMSHQIAAQVRAIDAAPASIAAHAITQPGQRPVGQKDKTAILMLLESIKTVCVQLQDEQLDPHDGHLLRMRMEEARRVLEGVSPVAI